MLNYLVTELDYATKIILIILTSNSKRGKGEAVTQDINVVLFIFVRVAFEMS